VELESIELDGYGPFQNSVQYDIHRDGMPRIRVISGENVDDLGSTSNGSGKTSLVMAPIWAFTGRTEMKGEHSWRKRTLANRDVVNDDCKNARVFVRGKINEVPFELERIVTKTTLKKLSFVYGGEDLTCQEARLTQEKIDSLVNTRLLARIICHDHDHINALLTANDRQMKEELGIIVDLEFWAAAKSVSSTKLREAKEILNNAASEEQISRRVLSNSSSHLQKCDAEYSNWEQSTVRRTDQLRSTLHHYESNQAGARDNLRGLLKAARAAIREVGSPSSCSSSDGFKDGNEIVDQVSASLQDQERSIKDLEDSLNALIPRRIDVEKSLSAVSYALKDSTKRFKSFSTLGESNTLVCERCNQEIDEQSYKEHLSEFHSDMEAKQRDQDKFVQSKKEVLDKEQVIRNRLRQEKEKYSRVQGELASKAASLGMERQMQESLLEKIRMFIHSCKDFGLEAESEVEMVEKKSESQSKANLSDLCSLIESGTKIFQTSQKLIDDTKQQMEVLKRQKNPFEVTMESLKKQKEQEEESVDLYGEKVQLYASQVDLLSQVDSAFSTSGVQSFAIEGALKQLQELTTANLEILSSNSLKLQLNATKKTKSKAALNSELESINKAIFSRNADGKFVPRNLPQLSGGERRRLGISLALGFSKLASVRSGLHCDLLVLDEVMQHLDDEGCKRLLTLIHTIPNSTVLLVAQPHTAAYDLVDAKDVVKKERNTASVARLY
jgi:DNA repair exonuclease SbcCD ATPase subunit